MELYRHSGFLHDYHSYAARLTDAPREFHAFCGLAALGACAPKVRVRFGSQALPPVLWTVLVAPSAFYRKTTSIELARRLVAAARPELRLRALYGAAEAESALRSAVSGDAESLLCVDNFADLLLANARELLARLSDSAAPVSLLAAASTSALACRVSAADISSGFLARFALVVAEQKTGWRPLPGAADAAAEAALADFLRRVSRIEGEADFSACRAAIRDWGHEAAQWVSAMPGGSGHWETAAGLVSRLEVALLKFAALIELSRSESLRISSESFEAARELEKTVRNGFGRLLSKELRRGNEFHQELRLMAMVSRHPGITRTRLLRNSHLSAGPFARLLETLLEGEHVRRNGHRYFPAPAPHQAAAVANSRKITGKNANGERIEMVEVS